MVVKDTVDQVFKESTNLYTTAMELLVAGDLRGAAEKAWCATKTCHRGADTG